MTDNIPNRRGMVLLHYRPSDRGGALFGRATVELPIRLEILDIAIFTKNGGRGLRCPPSRCGTGTGRS